jgi:hypothetical protein
MATTTRQRGIRIGGRTMTVPSNSETTPNRSEQAHFRPPPGFGTLDLEATMTELNAPVRRVHCVAAVLAAQRAVACR